MVYPYTQTRNQVIKRALRIVGVVAQGEEPTSEQLTEANEAMSATLKALSNEGIILWKQVEGRLDFATAASQVTHNSKTYLCTRSHTSTAATEPGVGASWHLYWREHSNSSKTAWSSGSAYTGTGIIEVPNTIIAIDKLWYNYSNSDTPIELINRFEFLGMPDKYELGRPQVAWFEAGEVSVLHLDYSVEDTTLTIRYLGQQMIDSFTGAGDTQDMPGQWIDALTYALASQLADEYQISLQERSFLTQKAIAKLKSARAATRDTRTGSYVRSCY